MSYKPLILEFDLFNTVQANDASTVRPKSGLITLPWLTNKESLKVSVNGVPSSDYRFTEPNRVDLDLTFDINSLPVNVVISRDTQASAETPDSLPASFTPGSAIRAQDLNANFAYLLELINEVKGE